MNIASCYQCHSFPLHTERRHQKHEPNRPPNSAGPVVTAWQLARFDSKKHGHLHNLVVLLSFKLITFINTADEALKEVTSSTKARPLIKQERGSNLRHVYNVLLVLKPDWVFLLLLPIPNPDHRITQRLTRKGKKKMNSLKKRSIIHRTLVTECEYCSGKETNGRWLWQTRHELG